MKANREIDIIISSGYLKLDDKIREDAALIIAKPFDLEHQIMPNNHNAPG